MNSHSDVFEGVISVFLKLKSKASKKKKKKKTATSIQRLSVLQNQQSA
jgi:hypothetical protein